MKVLVISDNKENVDFINSFFANKNYDVIVYKWLIKALDNIEEIRPNIIILSAAEYPRHWKTLASFVQSGIGGDNVKVYLYEPTPLDEEEEKKAQALGIEGCFSSLDNVSFEKYFGNNCSVINDNHEVKEEKLVDSQFIINKIDGELITGAVISKSDKYYKCNVGKELLCDDFANGSYFDLCSVYFNQTITHFSGTVSDYNADTGDFTISISEDNNVQIF